MTKQSTARAALLLAAATLLIACGKQDAAANDSANSAVKETAAPEAANAAAPAATPAAAPSGTLSADYMVGKWSAMDEDCAHTIEFKKDGTVTTPIGDAKWTLAGDKLTIRYPEDSNLTASTIKPLSPDRIEITTSSGRKETEKRCA